MRKKTNVLDNFSRTLNYYAFINIFQDVTSTFTLFRKRRQQACETPFFQSTLLFCAKKILD